MSLRECKIHLYDFSRINFTFFKVQIPIEIINSENTQNVIKSLNKDIICEKCNLKIVRKLSKYFILTYLFPGRVY